jgi:CTP:molybdopterin cytidylyltransferase MocA
MGGPKALLLHRSRDGVERPLALAHASCRLGAESARVVVVTRAEVAAVLTPHAPPGAFVAVSDFPDEFGPAGSLAAAMHLLAAEPLVLVTPVDLPPTDPALVRALLAVLHDAAAVDAVKPCYHGRGGHPVLLRRSVLAPYERAAPVLPPLRDVLRSLGSRSTALDLGDPSVLIDWDEATDLRRPSAFFRG